MENPNKKAKATEEVKPIGVTALDAVMTASQETIEKLGGNYTDTSFDTPEVRGAIEFPNFYKQAADKLGWSPFNLPMDMNREAYESQTLFGLAKNMIAGSAIDFASGFVSDWSSYDIPGLVNMVVGNAEKDYRNGLSILADEMRESSQEDFPIYTNGDSMWNFAYWANMGRQQAFTMGLISSTLATQAALAGTTGGFSLGANAFKGLSLYNKIGKAVKVGSRITSTIGRQALFGMTKGIQEGYINGLETYNAVYDKYKDLGYSEEEAVQLAGEAATYGFRLEVGPLMALNALQWAALGGVGRRSGNVVKEATGGLNQGFSGAVETLAEKFAANRLTGYKKVAASYAIQGGAEGVEEMIQSLVSSQAQYMTDKAEGRIEDFKSHSDYLFNTELRDSAVAGFFGGILLKGLGDGYNRIVKSSQKKEYNEAVTELINSTKREARVAAKEVRDAEARGETDVATFKRISNNLNATKRALELDLLRGVDAESSTAFESHIEQLQKIIDAIDEGDTQVLTSFGIETEEDIQYVKELFPQLIQNSLDFKESLLAAGEFSTSKENALVLATEETRQKTLEDQANAFEQRIAALEAEDAKNFPPGEIATRRLTFQLSVLADMIEKGEATEETKALYDRTFQRLSEEMAANSEEFSSLDQAKREFAVKEAIARTENSTDLKDASIVNLIYSKAILENAASKVKEKVSLLRDEKTQKELDLARVDHAIKAKQAKAEAGKNAKQRLKEVKKIKEDLKKLGGVTTETQEKVDSLESKAEVDAKVEDAGLGEPTKVDELPRRDDDTPSTVPPPERTKAYEELANDTPIVPSPEMQEEGENAPPPTTEEFDPNQDYTSLGPEETLFNIATETPEQTAALKDRVKTLVEGIRDELGRDPLFSEFINDAIASIGKDRVKGIFHSLARGWNLNKFPEVNVQREYDKKFGRAALYAEIESQFVSPVTEEYSETNPPAVPVTEEDIAEATEETLEHTAHYLSINYSKGAEGKKDTGTTLNPSRELRHQKLLSQKVKPGTKFTFRVPPKHVLDNMAVRIYDASGKFKVMNFRRWVRENFGDANGKDNYSDYYHLPEFVANLPLFAYDSEGDAVFMMKDVYSFNMDSVSNEGGEVIQIERVKALRAKNMALRDKIVKNGEVEVVITRKENGAYSRVLTPEPITLRQANPETQIGIGRKETNNVYVNGEAFFTEENGNTNVGDPEVADGTIYEIRKGTNEGQYIPLKVTRSPIAREVQSTIYQAVKAYLYGDAKNPEDVKVRDNILKATGLDVFDTQDLETFLSQFLTITSSQGIDRESLARRFNSQKGHTKEGTVNKLPDGMPWFSFKNGQLIIGAVRTKVGGREFSYAHPYTLGDQDGAKVLSNFLASLAEILPNAYQGVSEINLINNNKSVLLTPEGDVIEGSNVAYKEFLLDNLRTNIRSFNIGTNQNPEYVTMLQPVIAFEEVDNPTERQVQEKAKKAEQMSSTMPAVVVEGEELFGSSQTPQGESSPLETRQQPPAPPVDDLPTPEGIPSPEEVMARKESQAAKPIPAQESSPQGTSSPKPALTKHQAIAMLDVLLASGAKESSPAVVNLRKIIGNDTAYNVVSYSDEQVEKMSSDVTKVANLNPFQASKVVNFLYHRLNAKVKEKEKGVSKAQIYKEVLEEFFEVVNENLRRVEGLKQIADTLEDGELKTSLLEEVESRQKEAKNLKENYGALIDLVEDKASRINKFREVAANRVNHEATLEQQEEDLEDAEDLGDRVQDYSKTSLEENPSDSLSSQMRSFLDSIVAVDKEGNPRTTFLGLPDYIGSDTVEQTLRQVLAYESEVVPNLEDMISRMEAFRETYPWITQVIDRLRAADGQIKNQFAVNFAKHSLSMKFATYVKTKKAGEVTWKLEVYDTNSNEILRVIKTQWESNFRASKLVDSSGFSIDKMEAAALLEEFENIKSKIENRKLGKNKNTVSNLELQGFLRKVGIDLSLETIADLRLFPMEVKTPRGKVLIPFANQFNKSGKSRSLFGSIGYYLESVQQMENVNIEENEFASPFRNMSGVIDTISKMEAKHNTFATSNSFRDGGKGIYGYTPSKLGTDLVNELKLSQAFRDQLASVPFTSESFILSLLEQDEAFRDKFNVHHIGITALKELFKKAYGDNQITSLSEVDMEVAKLTFFQSLRQGEVRNGQKSGSIPLRIAKMFFPTMSDKSQMLMLDTAVLDLRDKHLEGESAELDEFLFSQLVLPELNRIVDFYTRGGKSNIKGYSGAAGMFLGIPILNQASVQDTPLLKLIGERPDVYTVEYILGNEEMKGALMSLMKSHLAEKVAEKITSWENNGIVKDGKLEISDGDYKNKFRDKTRQVEFAAKDYVYNSYVANANNLMLLAGDLALYGKDEFNNFFKDGKPWLPKEEVGTLAYFSIAKIIDDNFGKRMAMLMAPGNKIAYSDQEQYLQLALKDVIAATTNAEMLIKAHYPEVPITKGIKALVAKLSSQETIEEAIKELGSRFPRISPFLEIEATDAQEYTTAEEHISVLYRYGRLSEENYRTIQQKLKRGIALNHFEMGLVFQPIKPVYTGMQHDATNNVMAMRYVKSSSFPLLPQITKGLEIDGLRELMEKVQKTTGKNVRASYQSANKVGATRTPLQVFDSEGRFNPALKNGISRAMLAEVSTLMERKNFRIQQDVPYDENKKTVSQGTQALKLLFGNGITELGEDAFSLNGRKISGEALKEEFNRNYNRLIELKREELYRELGLDPKTGDAVNVEEAFNKVKDLLIREARERNFPQQDLDALEIIPIYNANDEIVDMEFNIPLWLSANSNRYESLLNAIVVNRLAKLKMPGFSMVAGSESGFTQQYGVPEMYANRIVYTSSWTGSLKAAEIEDGKLKRAQILMPSRLRDNKGKLIEFFNKDGSPNEKYIRQVTTNKFGKEYTRYELIPGKISKDLLNLVSFRTPTSSHVSMSSLEIVGFLPPEAGDLVILPKNLITQKGLDFDIDKENIYQKWHTVNEEGVISAISDVYLEAQIEKMGRAIERIQNKGEKRTLEELAQGIFPGALTQEELERLQEEKASLEEKLTRVKNKLEQKLAENKYIEIMDTVLSSPHPEVFKKINSALSMEFAQIQAEIIDNQINPASSLQGFSSLSDEHQKSKMARGAVGKLAIGVYSNYDVLISMAQQLSDPLTLMEKGQDGLYPVTYNIGGIFSSGVIGKVAARGMTLDGNRTIAEVIAERQNTATDNEKEGILGRVNVNETTINVDSLLVSLGYDQVTLDNGTQMSLPYLLLSQPIIRDYVELLRNENAKVKDFNSEARKDVVEALREKYPLAEEDAGLSSSALKGQVLFDNLNQEGADPRVQNAVLELFLDLDSHASKIRNLQSLLNVNTRGLGTSYFEAIEKYTVLDSFGTNFITLKNASKLIGDFRSSTNSEGENLSTEELQELREQGYVLLDGVLIKPETPVGSSLVHTINSGVKLWSDYFPYGNSALNAIMEEIIGYTSNEEISSHRRVELKHEIFKEVKKFLYTSGKLGVHGVSKDVTVNQARARLFIDKTDANGKVINTSLATYLNDLVAKDDPLIREIIKNNKLITRFSYDLHKDGNPSTIRFDNSKGEVFEEDNLYNALIHLMEENINLPDFNGKPYTSRDLASDLIAYNYLSGGVQEAVQFSKYIPVSLLNTTSFAEAARTWDPKKRAGVFAALLGYKGITQTSLFAKQFMQHNPNKAQKVTEEEVIYSKGKGSFVLKEYMDISPRFLAIYNPRLKEKYELYMKEGENSEKYNRIPVLGTFGMSEYNIYSDDQESIINRNAKPVRTGRHTIPLENSRPIVSSARGKAAPVPKKNLKTGDTVAQALDMIIGQKEVPGMENYGMLAEMFKVLIGNSPTEIRIIVAPIRVNGKTVARGAYSKKQHFIAIDTDFYNASEKGSPELAQTLLHEIAHAISLRYLESYVETTFDANMNPIFTIKDGAPAEVHSFMAVFNAARRQLGGAALRQMQRDLALAKRVGDVHISESDKNAYYGLTEPGEFITEFLTNSEFRKRLDNSPYRGPKKSFAAKLIEVLDSIMKKLIGGVKNDKMSYHAYEAVFSFLQKANEPYVGKKSLQSEVPQGEIRDAEIEDALPPIPDFPMPGEEDIPPPPGPGKKGGTPYLDMNIVFREEDKYNFGGKSLNAITRKEMENLENFNKFGDISSCK